MNFPEPKYNNMGYERPQRVKKNTALAMLDAGYTFATFDGGQLNKLTKVSDNEYRWFGRFDQEATMLDKPAVSRLVTQYAWCFDF